MCPHTDTCEISCCAGCEIFARKRANVMITLELTMDKLRLKRGSEIRKEEGKENEGLFR